MNFNIGLSALRASQFAVDTVSQNLANANTEGYHRQRVVLATRPPQYIGGQYIGTGVNVDRVDRIRNQVIEGAYTNSISDLKNLQQRKSIDGQIESLLLPGDGSIHQALGGFFDELARLSVNPNENVQRNAAISQAVNITKQTRDISSRLTDLKTGVKKQIDIEVNALNDEIAELVDLQHRISTASANGSVPNDLHDQRDQLINRIAEKIDVRRFENVQGGFGLTLAGNSVSLGAVPVAFKTAVADDGTISFQLKNTDRNIKFASGSLTALAESHNVTIDKFQNQVNEFAKTLIREVDQAHATGVGLNGPYNTLRSTRKVDSTSVPLNEAGLAFPVTAGELNFSVTDPAGDKRTYSIAIDPATDTLEDVANRISSLGNLQGVVDSKNGQLSVFATPGYRFDFTGNLETKPDLGNFSGTSTPQIGGSYEGTQNRKLSVTILGSGTIGKTPGLLAEITDVATGKVIAKVDIGEGYEAGSPLALSEGVTLAFSGGDVVDQDRFTTPLVAQSDSTGILSALGLNNFFSGRDASDINVSNRIIQNSRELASSRSGDVADTRNLAGLVALRDLHVAGEERLTFEDYLSGASAEIGFQVKTSNYLEQNISELNYQYQSEIASVSGVDPNEELLSLAQYQKQYEAAVRVIQTIDSMLTELFSIIR